MAFATLSERYRKQLFRAAYRITRSCENAEDAVQDSLLRPFVHITDFDGRSSFGTWLTDIAINSALMILRKKRASLEIAMDGNDEFAADGPRHVITDHAALQRLRSGCVWSAQHACAATGLGDSRRSAGLEQQLRKRSKQGSLLPLQ